MLLLQELKRAIASAVVGSPNAPLQEDTDGPPACDRDPGDVVPTVPRLCETGDIAGGRSLRRQRLVPAPLAHGDAVGDGTARPSIHLRVIHRVEGRLAGSGIALRHTLAVPQETAARCPSGTRSAATTVSHPRRQAVPCASSP